MKCLGQWLSPLARALRFSGLITGRAVWLALATMLAASAASADGPSLAGQQAQYQQYAGATLCSTGSCTITFPAVIGETLISQVTCSIDVGNDDGVSYAVLSNGLNGAGEIANYLPPLGTGGSDYEINTETQMFFSSGQQPSVIVFNFSGVISQFECSVSGQSVAAALAAMPSASAVSASGPILTRPATPYQQAATATGCSAGNCAVAFPAVTAQTLISQVTCVLYLENDGPIYTADLWNGVSGAGEILNYFAPILTAPYSSGSFAVYVINAETQMFLSPGQQPSVNVANSQGTIAKFDCSVSGYTGPELAAGAGVTTPSAARAADPSLGAQLAPYQQFASASSCNTGICSVTFPAVTAETLISQVTCSFVLGSIPGITEAYLWNGATGPAVAVNYFPAVATARVNNFTNYVINAPTQLLLTSGQTPLVAVVNSVGAIVGISCSVSGYSGSDLAARTAPTPPSARSVPPSAASAAGTIPGGQAAPYQQYGATTSCGQVSCVLTFPAVAGETFISQVTCFFQLNFNFDPVYIAFLSNGATGDGEALNILPPILTGMYNSDSTYVINAQTQIYLSAGQQPAVVVKNSSGTIALLDCSLSGQTGPDLASAAGATPPSAAGAVDPIPSASPYQQYGTAGCPAGHCTVTFPAVSAETFVSQVTCYFSLTNTDPIYLAYLWNGATEADVVQEYFPTITTGTYNNLTSYVINAPTQMLLSPGQTPSVYVFNTTGAIQELLCSVSGYRGSELLARAGPTPPPAGPLPPTPAGLMPPSPGLPLFTRVPAQ